MKPFSDQRYAPLWTVVRVWLGYTWISSALGKLSSPVWIGGDAGVAISGFFQGALAKAEGPRAEVTAWYAGFIENVALPNAIPFSYLIVFGELLVGVSLILGALTLLGLLGSAFMNLNFLLAGTSSANPQMYTAAILLLFAGERAYHFGLDRFLLSWIGSRRAAGRRTRSTA